MSTALYVTTPAQAVEAAVIRFLYLTIVEGEDQDEALATALAKGKAGSDLRGCPVNARGTCPTLLAQAKAYRKAGRMHIVSEKTRRRRDRPVE